MSEWRGAADGISILDFTWWGVGPITTKYLADNGAHVVKVESNAHLDGLRSAAPWKDARPGNINTSQFFGDFNSSKKSVALDMRTVEARDIVRRLVPHFDVVAESFTPGTMAKWGLGYSDLQALRPDVIMLSTCMQGQTGPHAHYAGFGGQLASLCGFYDLTGYSEGEIAPPYGAYTDVIVPRLAAFALLSAVEYRRQTGEGQYLDISQYEAALHFLAPPLLDYLAGGPVATPRANRSDRYAPHGAYQFADEDGEERWVALAVEDDDQWLALLQVLGQPEQPRFDTVIARLEAADELDTYLEKLVRNRPAQMTVESLQAAGVAAYPVQTCQDLHADENLLGFNFWQWLDQRDTGLMPYDGLSYRLDRTGSNQSAAPSFGQHTDEILTGTLGMSNSEITRLRETGVIN